MKKLAVIFVLTLLFSSKNYAVKGVYQTPKAFIGNVFLNVTPQASVLWLDKEDKAIIADILQHKYNRMRIPYWQLGNETVWVLNELGKEKPITIGVHIKDNKIRRFKVLTFRENRGDEVHYAFYAEQFINAKLEENNQLSQHIDGITGATLSVRATTKVARLSLWLHNKVLQSKL